MICGDVFRQLKQHNCLYYLNSGFSTSVRQHIQYILKQNQKSGTENIAF